ncbi:hypothetical protein TIFTF001_004333 [Ficus carica]|uniref:Uncharacterized protein n=1 Tax=Ficus carica TaxID=3494 RepID=A0AA88CX04_FICCA|nr:hypothetical protein TIFTF001_004333 [Ficus carica]
MTLSKCHMNSDAGATHTTTFTSRRLHQLPKPDQIPKVGSHQTSEYSPETMLQAHDTNLRPNFDPLR